MATIPSSQPPRNPLIAVVGATGTGKSQLAIDLALRFNGEIINADAMQLYDGLPIITNKIPENERKGVPHHLLGCVKLDEQPWRADVFVRKALETIANTRARGKLPILVGGTHYYTQSLLFHETLIDAPSDEEHSTDLGNVGNGDEHSRWPILHGPPEEMLAKLKEVDPVMAERWHPGDVRKIRRSLEIWLRTGRRASDLYAEQELRRQLARDAASCGTIANPSHVREGGVTEAIPQGLRFPTLLFWVYVERDTAAKRLEARTDTMMADGLVREALELDSLLRREKEAGKHVDVTRGIYTAIGYKEFRGLLDALHAETGDESRLRILGQQGREMTTNATRRYAKTQTRWIRIKLVNALREAGADHSMIVLDATNLLEWSNKVLDPATESARAFLDGSAMPLQDSDLTRELLQPQREYDLGRRKDLWKQQTCEVCNVTTVMEEEWQKHIKSHRHRQILRRKERRLPKPVDAENINALEITG